VNDFAQVMSQEDDKPRDRKPIKKNVAEAILSEEEEMFINEKDAETWAA